MSSNGLADRVEMRSSSSVSTERVLVVLVPLEIPPAGEVTPAECVCGSELDNDWIMIMGEPSVSSLDSNWANMGDERGGKGEVIPAGLAFVAVSTVNTGELAVSNACECLLLRLSLLEDLQEPELDRLRKPETAVTPAELTRNGEIRPPIRLCIILLGVEGRE